ncbi:MAG TPA: DUF2637 domain-containing protein [Streptosporangiaceae bacterium]|jgi:hypothetical protein
MNPRTRRAALHAIAVIAILASINALAHSYAGLYQWAIHHRMTGWQALTWPAEIDVFLIIGELALYVAYLDAWTARHKLWPWATALLGLTVSVAGNIGHIPTPPGGPIPAADRLTAATSPLAAFAGLAIALLVLKQTRSTPDQRPQQSLAVQPQAPESGLSDDRIPAVTSTIPMRLHTKMSNTITHTHRHLAAPAGMAAPSNSEPPIVQDARDLRTEYEQRGARLTRRQLASQLRARGHTLANNRLRELAKAIDLP